MGQLSVFGDLIKYKLSLAVLLSALTGYFISGSVNAGSFLFMASGLFLLAASAAILNQYSERSTDRLMERTKNRPVASGKVTERQAILIFIFFFSAGLLLLSFNGIKPVLLGILNVVLYNIVYTRLKRITILAIIPGGFVGAIPPLIGYTSAGTEIISPEILFFSVFMFLWQIPHFWLLIIRYGEEYRKAGLATISSYLNETQLKKVIFLWIVLSNATFLVFFIVTGMFGLLFVLSYILMNAIFIILFFRNLFGYSGKNRLKGAIILINSYGLIIMLMLIAVSVF
jgi:protoheme IX farnesyltransferase